jgi:hypothetical protein
MRNVRRAYALVVLSLWFHAAAGACNSHIPEYALVDGGEGGPSDAAEDRSEAAEDSGDAEASVIPGPSTEVRFAVWSPDTPEADFCVAPLASQPDAGDSGIHDVGAADVDADAVSFDSGVTLAWQGPLVAQAAAEVDGGIGVFPDADTPGVTFPQVTAYLELPASAYLVRAVAAGSFDCSLPLLPVDQPLPALKAGTRTTVAIVGDFSQSGTGIHSDPTVKIEALTDDSSGTGGRVALRFVPALPSVASLSLGTGAFQTSGYSPIFVGVPFGQAGAPTDSDAGKVDDNGYVAIAPLSSVTLTATAFGVDAGGPAIVAEGVSMAAGSVVTLAAVGGKTADPLQPSQFLLCLDTAPATGVVFADCNVLPSPGD